MRSQKIEFDIYIELLEINILCIIFLFVFSSRRLHNSDMDYHFVPNLLYNVFKYAYLDKFIGLF